MNCVRCQYINIRLSWPSCLPSIDQAVKRATRTSPIRTFLKALISTTTITRDTMNPDQNQLNAGALMTPSKASSTANGSQLQNGGACLTSLDSKIKSGEEFLRSVALRMVKEMYQDNQDPAKKVVEFLQPNELEQRVDWGMKDQPCANEELEELCQSLVKYSMRSGHPMFFNQLFNGVDPFAFSGALLEESLHSSAYTYEVAPCHILIERGLINEIGLKLIGYDKVDGIFTPGGSAANMYGLSIARYHKYPESKTSGMRGLPPLHIYTSKLSHYSITKGAFFLGFGTDAVIQIECDNRGRMDVKELEKAVQKSRAQGFMPFCVNATSGTTVRGAYDPIDEIADVCKANDIWLHVDAAWGGAVLLSDKLRYKMKGVDRADSIIWDPHKMAGSILQCSLILTKHEGLLAAAHSAQARYLFQTDKVYDVSYDTGDKSLQCGRKLDGIKLWVQWKAYGTQGMGARIERMFDNALHLRDELAKHPNFRLVVEEPECLNVCFWYIPPSMVGETEDEDWWNKLAKVAPAIKGQMQIEGSMMVGYQPEGDLVPFFRMICSSAHISHKEMDNVVSIIHRIGKDL